MGAPLTIDDIWVAFHTTRSAALRNKLITEYATLVHCVVGKLRIPSSTLLEIDDLISYGMIGLINAIDRFDPSRGVRFEVFAAPRIRGSVIDELRLLNWMPRSALAHVRQIEETLASLEQRLGRPAREEEVARELGVPRGRYRQMLLEAEVTVLSLDIPLDPLAQDDTASLGDIIEDQATLRPDEQVEQRELTTLLATAIERLPMREQLLLALYYQEELTMKEISKIVSLSESRVCQLHMQTMIRLRTALNTLQADVVEEPSSLHLCQSHCRNSHVRKVKKTQAFKTTADSVCPK